jgi:hypothetical protein
MHIYFNLVDRYESSSNINQAFYIKHLLIAIFSKIPIFVHILPAPLYTISIAQAPSLCCFQKEFVIACPAIIAHKV